MMTSFFKKDISPYRQLMVILVTMIAFHLIFYVFTYRKADVELAKEHYTIGIAFLLLFALFNAILSFTTNNDNVYWTKSLFSYVIILVVGLALSYFLSGIHINEVDSIRNIIMVFTFAYLLILAIARTIKFIALVADKEHEKATKDPRL